MGHLATLEDNQLSWKQTDYLQNLSMKNCKSNCSIGAFVTMSHVFWAFAVLVSSAFNL
jgi:hypothetical protein